nr:MAG TPA: hypothetical protein [Caudoviricetes sp.]
MNDDTIENSTFIRKTGNPVRTDSPPCRSQRCRGSESAVRDPARF